VTQADPRICATPGELAARGAEGAPFRDAMGVEELPPGGMVRVTWGDLDVLVANTSEGIVATDDRCPHMSAPLSMGVLDGCLVDCPLHQGRFDLSTGNAVRFPTTGGLDADGNYHEPWAPAGSPAKPEPTDTKARARALTRIRAMRYYPVRIREGRIEVATPP
jgi:nitrite reductase/ring-hydroxylating ferredoxin subunit